MKSTQAPTPPDPTATIAAQTQSNKDTAGYQQSMNLIDQNTPLGSLTYTNTGVDPVTGAPKYSQNISLSPTGQKEFDLQQQTGEALDNLALAGTGQVQSAMSQSQSYSGLPSITTIDPSKLPGLTGIDPSKLPGLSTIDPSSLGALPSYDAAGLNAKAPTANKDDYTQAQKALLDQFTMSLDPQWQQQEKTLKDHLTQQGITEGSSAWNTAVNNFQLQKTQAYQTANNNAVTGATGIEQAQYGMENQSYQDLVANALNENNAKTSAYGLNLGTQEAQVGEKQQNYQLGLNTQQAQAGENQQNYQLGLGTQQAEDASNLAARQQGITEADYLRELPINEVSALLNGGQVSMPSFSNTPQTQVANTNTAGITQNSFADQEQNYQTATSANSAAIGAIFGAAGTALGGWATGGFA